MVGDDRVDNLHGLEGVPEDDGGQLLVPADGECGQFLGSGVDLRDGEVGSLEDGVVTLVVAEVEVILEYSEEVDRAHLLLELGAVEEYYVFAVLGQAGEGTPDAPAAEIGDHGGTEEE